MQYKKCNPNNEYPAKGFGLPEILVVIALVIFAVCVFSGCATADNPQRLGGVNISGSVVFLDGNLSKTGDNAAASHQTPHNEITPDINANLAKGASGANTLAGAAAEAAAALKRNLAEPATPAPAPAPQPQPLPLPAPQPTPAPKPDAAPISPAA